MVEITPAPATLIVRRTADSATITANTTPASDDTLTTTALATSTVYGLDGLLWFAAANATMDLKVGWAVPTGCTMLWGVTGSAANAGALNAGGTGATPGTVATESTVLSVGSGNLTFPVHIRGFVAMAATAGTFALQWAQVTSDPGTLKILANSYLMFTRL